MRFLVDAQLPPVLATWLQARAVRPRAEWVAPADAAPRYGIGAVDDAFEALSFSWNNVFRPLSALSAESLQSDDRNFEAQLLYGYPPWVGFLVRLVATLQSLFAIVLAFLFALAVRRRFQIS